VNGIELIPVGIRAITKHINQLRKGQEKYGGIKKE